MESILHLSNVLFQHMELLFSILVDSNVSFLILFIQNVLFHSLVCKIMFGVMESLLILQEV